MNNTNYSVDVLVNDKPIRKYPFDGKLFIEARDGQEYSIRIKNNTWQRILAITSIDGLDVLNGKAAKENGNGYVINGYGSLNLDGFRISDEKVAKFLFGTKGDSYAASKGDNSERNVGVVGIRLFEEKVRPAPVVPIIIREEHHHHHNDHPWNWPLYNPTITPYPGTPWCQSGTSYGFGSTNGTGTSVCSCNNSLSDNISLDFASNNSPTKGSPLRAMNMCSPAPNPRGFDMGTSFGKSKESRVIEVEFEKGILALTTNIYYASRQSLIEMGVQMGNEKQVSFPEPFTDGKYANPQMGWKS